MTKELGTLTKNLYSDKINSLLKNYFLPLIIENPYYYLVKFYSKHRIYGESKHLDGSFYRLLDKVPRNYLHIDTLKY